MSNQDTRRLQPWGVVLHMSTWKGDFYEFLPAENGVTIPFRTRGFTASKRLTTTKFSHNTDRIFLVIRVLCPGREGFSGAGPRINPGVSGWIRTPRPFSLQKDALSLKFPWSTKAKINFYSLNRAPRPPALSSRNTERKRRCCLSV